MADKIFNINNDIVSFVCDTIIPNMTVSIDVINTKVPVVQDIFKIVDSFQLLKSSLDNQTDAITEVAKLPESQMAILTKIEKSIVKIADIMDNVTKEDTGIENFPTWDGQTREFIVITNKEKSKNVLKLLKDISKISKHSVEGDAINDIKPIYVPFLISYTFPAKPFTQEEISESTGD